MSTTQSPTDTAAPTPDPAGEREELSAPDMKTARFGIPQKYWRYRRWYKKRRKLGSKGYVEWYLVDNTRPPPKFVKPEGKGGGVREYEHDGETYLFPEKAMIPDEETGIPVVYHRRGDALPVDLNDPLFPSLRADELKDYLTKRVTTSPPGFFDSLPFDLNAQTLVGGAIAMLILFASLQMVLGGG